MSETNETVGLAPVRWSAWLGDDGRTELLKLAGEMVAGVGMPSTFLEDWKLPKTTPRRACRQIRDAADKADEQCKRWAVRLRGIIDAAAKSPNDKLSEPPTK